MSDVDPNAERDAEVLRWISGAREDLRAAAAVLRAPGFVPRHACFWAQQAAEKAIKAVLVYRGITFRRIHDLDALRKLIPDPASWSVTQGGLALAPLTVWATEARYPGEHAPPDEADATKAIVTARTVVDRVVADLRRLGFVLAPPGADDSPGGSQTRLPL
jgi:HEPN domain-containing protein